MVIAVRAPRCLDIGIATALTAGLWLIRPPAPSPWKSSCEAPPPIEEVSVPALPDRDVSVCDTKDITSVVIRGQFTSDEPQGFMISFPGHIGHYTAITDKRGYFELRIPREDFADDLCSLPTSYRERRFSDNDMVLTYEIDVERE